MVFEEIQPVEVDVSDKIHCVIWLGMGIDESRLGRFSGEVEDLYNRINILAND